MELLDKIINTENEEEIKDLLDQEIKIKNDNATKVEELGMSSNGVGSKPFKGFLPLETRIKYSNRSVETYSMNTKDFFYEYALFLKKQNITKKGMFVAALETFMNNYFGTEKKHVSRETIFNDIPFQNTETDEEYFAALDNNSIGDLKGTSAAECTERAAMAQQILSLFDIETYYCIGCIKKGTKEEAHAFNIAKTKNGYALLDYSMPVTRFNEDGKAVMYFPFMEEMTELEFEEFINGGKLKDFNDYEFVNNEKISNGQERTYIVNSYEITKNITDMK